MLLNKKKRIGHIHRPKPSPPKPSPQPLRNSSASLHYRRCRCHRRRTPLYLSALTATSRRNPLCLSALTIVGRTIPLCLSALAVAVRLPSISPYHRTTARVSKPFDSHSPLYIKPKAQSKEIINALKDIENDWGKKKKGETVNTLRKKRKKQESSKEKKILECPPESQNTTNIADDAISIVFGNEAHGRVRGMGFGVTPLKVGTSVQQNGMIQQLQTIVQNVQQQMQEMRQQNQLEMQEMRSMFLQSMRQQNHPEQVSK
ncbi:hypothetical protein ZIOFF_041522 [Zingiber officinale]|uniref:Uncharacterized protein n=1 Tax=Zingiber officinale TaxID=94328 RepID=A0A8J5KYV1_ZINOF|nr:hypothetical protein ZIOFF_041522 [Zingiber officinale]